MPIDILSLPLLCGDHIRDLARVYRGEGPSGQREGEFTRIVQLTTSCPACLQVRWQADFDRASRFVRGNTIAVYLNDMAELKRTFPGYPLESTPRSECRSVEEYLLKDGQTHGSRTLTPGEAETVRGVLRELKSRRDRRWESRTANHRKGRVSSLLDVVQAFATAQLAWRLSDGSLDYVEGFARHGEESPFRFGWYREVTGPRYYPWNLINGKVVDFCSRRLPRDDEEFWRMLRHIPFEACLIGRYDSATEYFGCVLTGELEKQVQTIPGRFWGERILVPDKDQVSLREQLQREREGG